MEQSLHNFMDSYASFLNQLSESTGDYYLFYNCEADTIFFSDNARLIFNIFPEDETCCSLEQWRSIADSRDLPKLRSVSDALFQGLQATYNLSYRVHGPKEQLLWVNSRGKCHMNSDGSPAYVLGRISTQQFPMDKGNPLLGPYSNQLLKQELTMLLNQGQEGFLLLVGVDNLKFINLKHGREYGDIVVRELSEYMSDLSSGGFHPYRINGDCFAISLIGFSVQQVTQAFRSLQERMAPRCTISGGCVSLNQYQVPDGGTLLQYAESSLDAAKANGKNMLSFFSPGDYEKKLSNLELREDLEQSIQSGFAGFSLDYQPQVRSESYDLFGAEALLRYCSPRRGSVCPAEFIPILEETDLIYPVGLWVIRQALKQCLLWRQHLPQFHMSVNMSYSQLSQAAIERDVVDILKESGLPGNALTIEVTESMELLDYPHLNNIFRTWKKHGIEISVDDFGTGYSSLGRLKEMEIDEIKIDRCFISGIQESAYNYRLLSNMLELADSCQIRVCCEGVETTAELSTLEELHSSLYQGYLFSKPLPADEFTAVMEQWEGRAQSLRKAEQSGTPTLPGSPLPFREKENEIARTILEAEDDIFYLSDMDTYELYYLNPAGQRLFGVRDYQGRKCYKVLHGADAPCSFCTNPILRRDSFHVWEDQNEYCGRHLLLKDKMVSYQGKNIRLEVALDITKKEYISQATQERLDFADKIVGYMDTLSSHSDYSEAVNQVLASVGDFYQADRAYLFEQSPNLEGHWSNTFEWCGENVEPQQAKLQDVPPEALARWLSLFEKNESIIIFNLSPLRKTSPIEWKVLHSQGIQRLIAVPIRNNGVTIGFIGVDNPHYAIHDDSQVRVLASFLLTRIRQDRNEHRYQALLQESNQDIVEALGVGFWTIHIHKNSCQREMIANNTMCQILGASFLSSPQECYRYWHTRIPLRAEKAVDDAIHQMCQAKGVVQVEFPWLHPLQGEIPLRFSGLCLEETDECVSLKGYCRLLKSFS